MNEESNPESTDALKPPPRPVIPQVTTPPPAEIPSPTPQPSGLPEENAAARLNLGDHGGSGSNSSDETVVTFNTRVVAAVIDWVVVIGVWTGLTWILPGFAEGLGWLSALAYWVTRDSLPFLGGQSIGKKAMKIKVVTLDNQSLIRNWPISLIRNGVLLIPFFALIELYILLTRETQPERGRRLGDDWAKTKVVAEPKPQELDVEGR